MLCKLSDVDFFDPILCLECWQAVYQPIFTFQVISKGPHAAYFLSAAKYENRISSIIRSAKYHAKPLPFHICSLLLRAAIDQYPLDDYDYICSVPSVLSRVRKRGINLTLLLGKDFQTKLPFQPNLIQRKRTPLLQTNLKKADRIQNLKGVFVASPLVKNKKIIVVDDVITTGATAQAVISCLYEKNAQEVLWLTVARTHKKAST